MKKERVSVAAVATAVLVAGCLFTTGACAEYSTVLSCGVTLIGQADSQNDSLAVFRGGV